MMSQIFYKNNFGDLNEILKQLSNQEVLVEFVPHSPSAITEGIFAKGKLNFKDHQGMNNSISITLKFNKSTIEFPCEDIYNITPINFNSVAD
jgi:hypothetical protein